MNENDYLSVSKCFTEEEVNQLLQIGTALRVSCWEVGRFINRKAEQIQRSGKVVCMMGLYEYVSELLGEISARSVRLYSDIAAFYPLEIEEAYEVLPFSHFVTARRVASTFKVDPRKVLDIALEMMQQRNGRRPSAEYLEQIAINLLSSDPDTAPESMGELNHRWDPPEEPATLEQVQGGEFAYGISYQDGQPVLQIRVDPAPGGTVRVISSPKDVLITVIKTVILPLVHRLDRPASIAMQPFIEDMLDTLERS